MPFSAKCSERKCLHDKDQCLNTAIKYSLLFSWQVNYLKTKQSTWCLGDTSRFAFTLANTWSFWLLELRRRLHGKKSFHSRTKYDWSTTLNRTFLQTLARIQSSQFAAAVMQELNFTASKHFELQIILGNSHNWRMWNSSLSLSISRGLLLVPVVVLLGCKLSH